MSVVFFEVDELANVGAVISTKFYGGVSQQCQQAAEWLSAYSTVNARAYNRRYKEKAAAYSTAELYTAIYSRWSKKPDKAAAWASVSLFRYNAAEAEPTANELNVICTILENTGRALFTE